MVYPFGKVIDDPSNSMTDTFVQQATQMFNYSRSLSTSINNRTEANSNKEEDSDDDDDDDEEEDEDSSSYPYAPSYTASSYTLPSSYSSATQNGLPKSYTSKKISNSQKPTSKSSKNTATWSRRKGCVFGIKHCRWAFWTLSSIRSSSGNGDSDKRKGPKKDESDQESDQDDFLGTSGNQELLESWRLGGKMRAMQLNATYSQRRV
jgi:hypothetical protein